MPGSHPPYALDLTSFRFPALAALAGRAPLGGAREAALAALLLARLAATAAAAAAGSGLAGSGGGGGGGEAGGPPPDAELRRERAALARQWLSGITLPPPTRGVLARAVDATGQAAPQTLRPALDAALAALSPLLDPAGRAELQQLAAAIGV